MSSCFVAAILLFLVFVNTADPATSLHDADSDIDDDVDTLPSTSSTDSMNERSNSRGLSNRVSWAASRAMKFITLLLLSTSGLISPVGDAAQLPPPFSTGANANPLEFLSAGLPPRSYGEPSDYFDFPNDDIDNDPLFFGTDYIDLRPEDRVFWKDRDVGEHIISNPQRSNGAQKHIDAQHSQANWIEVKESASMDEKPESRIPSSQTTTPGTTEDEDDSRKSELKLIPSISGIRRFVVSTASLLGTAYSLFLTAGQVAQSICSVWQLIWVSLSLTIALSIFFPRPFLFSIGSFAVGIISSLVSFPFILSRRSLIFFWLSSVFAASGMMQLLAGSLKNFSMGRVKLNAPEFQSSVKSLSALQPSPAPIIKPDVPTSLPGWFMETRERTLALAVAAILLLWLLIALSFNFFLRRRKALLNCPSEHRDLNMENDSVVHISLSEPSSLYAGPYESTFVSRPRSVSI